MINLLPDYNKKQIRAARTNVVLINYIIALSIAVVFLTLACSVVYFFLNSTKSTSEESVETGKQSTASYAVVKKQADKMTADLLSAKTVLDQQISYSDIIMGIGAALPTGVIIDTISLSNDKIDAPIALKLRAHSADLQTSIIENLQKSPLFKNCSVQSKEDVPKDTSGYPVVFNVSLTINRTAVQ